MIVSTIIVLSGVLWQAWATPTAVQCNMAVNTPSLSIPAVASASTAEAALQLEHLATAALGVAKQNIVHRDTCQRKVACTSKNIQVRRNWRAFSLKQKRAFIRAVRCLQRRPAQTPSKLAPGAKTRYDDFVATHINQTGQIHYSGTFLSWHRYFIYHFYQALRHECGYTGDYPYWDWGADTEAMEKSPIFDGSDTSMSGNGVYIPNQPDCQLPLHGFATIPLVTGSGGGCVTSGPFKDYKLNLGPADLILPGGNHSAAANPLDYNPRCLKRDLTTALLRRFANYTAIVQTILQNDNIFDFEIAMQGVPGSGSIGVHGGGHYSIGGDPSRDGYVSPGDPAFWQHHGMIDRVWWIWQQLDLPRRLNVVAGTGTFLNLPPSAEVTLDTVINLGYAGGDPIALRDVMSTTAGPFCYVYV